MTFLSTYVKAHDNICTLCFMMGKAQGFGTFSKCRAGLNYSFVLGPFFWGICLFSINGVLQMDVINMDEKIH